jgi:diguanylate cyclase (GGDEF)-like protein
MTPRNTGRGIPYISAVQDDQYKCQAPEARSPQLASCEAQPGLPRLAYIDDLRRRASGPAGRPSRGFTVIMVGLEDFRLVEKGFGRVLGDKLLQDITLELTSLVGKNDSVERAGASEFLVTVADVTDSDDAAAIAQHLLDAIAKPRRLKGRDLRITARAGTASYPTHGEDFETLRSNARAALQDSGARSDGGRRHHRPEVEQRVEQHLQLTKRLSNAIAHHELSLHFQPQYEIRGGHHCGVEALARWFRPNGESIPPAIFVRHAEQTGLISALGAWVLEEACMTVATWHRLSEKPPVLCVNVSPHQICLEFSALLSRTLERTGFPAPQLELEITEGILIESPEFALECLAQWKRLGVRIAIDDFGTGYSSLSYLSRLPVDRLKVDKSLIHRMVVDAKTAAIVRAVISLGADFGFAVLAEGVETEEQLEMLAGIGCQQVQGYLFTPPVRADEARSLLAKCWGARRLNRPITVRPAVVSSLAL